jgi:hypothetical protein
MKERQILFSAPMMRVILDGRKTQTRRMVKPSHGGTILGIGGPGLAMESTGVDADGCEHVHTVTCPYGQPGDRLYVKETFCAFGRWETRYSAKKGRDEWHFVDMTLECGQQYEYPADNALRDYPLGALKRDSADPHWWKRPAIFMPRSASRITLEVVSVMVEQLQDISEADALAEGCESKSHGTWWQGYHDRLGDLQHTQVEGETPPDWMIEPHKMAPKPHLDRPARDAYRLLWDQINGPDAWALNPFVWCVEFRRVTP